MQLTPWQRLRTRAFLFAIGIKRRMTFGVRVILIDGTRVFLIRHTYLPGWQFPGGGVEPGETAADSAAREVLEETGHQITGPLQLFGLYHNVSPASNRDHVAVYLCREFAPVRAFRPNFEIADAGWFALEALPPDLSPGTARRLAEVFGEARPSSVW